MTENNFRYHIDLNYDKSESACIDLSCVVAKKKKDKKMMCSWDQLRKLIAKERQVGRMSRALIWHLQLM